MASNIDFKKPSLRLLNNILNTLNKNGYGARPVWQLLHKVSYLKKYPKQTLKLLKILQRELLIYLVALFYR